MNKKTKAPIEIPEHIVSYVPKPKIIELVSAIEEYKRQADAIIIFDEADIEAAGQIIKKFSELKKNIEALRKKAVDPLNMMVKGINSFFKGLLSFEQNEQRLRNEINKFIEEQRGKEQEEVINDIFEERTEVEIKLQTPELTTVKRKTWELVDINQVSREYLILNEKLINEVRQSYELDAESPIPGIKFTITEQVRVK